MLSKSTKTKHRKNHSFLKKVKSIQVLCTDKRVDFWLISIPKDEHYSDHIEVYGHKNIPKIYRGLVETMRKALA